MLECDATFLLCKGEQTLGIEERFHVWSDIHTTSIFIISRYQYFGTTLWVFILGLVDAWLANINFFFSEFMLRYVTVQNYIPD